jgi:hypothetical protein
MRFHELPRGSWFRCQLETEAGSRVLVDCVKLSGTRFRRLDSGKYVKPSIDSFPVAMIPKPSKPPD